LVVFQDASFRPGILEDISRRLFMAPRSIYWEEKREDEI